MPPKISVCIPTYNRPEYLSIAIQSALNQTYRDFELIIIDDGSTPETASAVNTFHDSRIRFLRNEQNLGYVRNWNRCLVEARSEFVIFLLDDDTFEPEILEKQIAILIARPSVGFVGCDIGLIDGEGKNIPPDNGKLHPYHLYNQDTQESGIDFIKKYIVDMRPVGVPTSIMFRKSLALPIGFDIEADFAADIELWCRLATQSNFFYINQRLCHVRLHATNVSHIVTKKDPFNYRRRYYLLNKIFSGYTFSQPKEKNILVMKKKKAFQNITSQAVNNAFSTWDRQIRQAIWHDIFATDPFLSNRLWAWLSWHVVDYGQRLKKILGLKTAPQY